MSECWPRVELGQAGVAVLDCVHATPKDAGAGYPYLAIPNIRDNRIDLSGVRRICDADFEAWTARYKPAAGDVLVTRRGRVGDTAVVPYGLECAIGQNLVLLRSDGSRVDQRYLAWACRGPDWWTEVDRLINVGAVFNSLNVRDLPRFRLPVPSLDEQRRIAGVLGALDELINTNQVTIASLTELVQAEFELRFGERELGLTVADVASVIDCLHSKKPELAASGRILLQLNNILDSGLLDLAETYVIKPDDYVRWTRNLETRAWDCVITNVGRVGAVARIPTGVRAALGRNMTAVRPRQPAQDGAFILASLLSRAVRQEIELRTDSGTILNALNVRSIPKLRLPEATPSEREGFQAFAACLLTFADSLHEESLTLRRQRDELLPLLLSGRVRVEDVAA